MRPPTRRAGRTTFLAAAGLAAAIAAAAPTGVLAAALKTTGFVAETPNGFTALSVSHDGRQVSRAFIAYTQKCSDNTHYTDWDRFAAIPISSSGAFKSSYDSGPLASTVTPGETIEAAGEVSGKLNRKHTQIAGSARFAFTIKRADGTTVTCDTGILNFTARD